VLAIPPLAGAPPPVFIEEPPLPDEPLAAPPLA
jgi:hypothetical protein